MDTTQIVTQIVQCAMQELQTLVQDLIEDQPDLYQAETRLFEGLMSVGRTVLTQWLKAQATPTKTVLCSDCGAALSCHRRPTRTLLTMFGEVACQRGYYYCRPCQRSERPVDEALGLDGCGVTKALREVCAWVGAHEPFAEAAKTVRKLLKLEVSPSTLYRQARKAGEMVCAKEELERRLVEGKRQALESVAHAPERLYLGMDGVMVHVDGGWHEVKVGVTFEGEAVWDEAGEQETDAVVNKQVLARYEGAETFVERYRQAVVKAGGQRAAELVCVSDAAGWIQAPLKSYFPQMEGIVDWYHATEHLSAAANLLYGEGSGAGAVWRGAQEGRLWKGQVGRVVAQMKARAGMGEEARAGLERERGYFERHREQMDYPRYRAQGMHIGSGVLESAGKEYVTQRAKGSGMRWKGGLNPVLALRCHVLNETWERGVIPFL